MMRPLAFALVLCGLIAGAPARADQITIAAIGSLSGSSAGVGEEIQRGAYAAIKAINAAGGLLGKPIKLLIADDACDPERGVAAARDVLTQGAQAIIGHYCSGASIPASEIYNKARVLQISPASTNPAFTDRGRDNVYRICGRDEEQAQAATDYIAANFKGKPIAVVDDKSLFGEWIAGQVRKNLNAAGLNQTLSEQIEVGQTDFFALIERMQQFKAAAVYFGGYQREAGLLIKEARAAGLKIQMVAGDALTTKEFWQTAGPAGEGVVFTSNPDPRASSDAAAAVSEFRRQRYDPEGYTLYTYAAIQVFADAAKEAKSIDLVDLNTVLHAKTFHTVLGDISFDAKGDRSDFRYALFRWHNGTYAAF